MPGGLTPPLSVIQSWPAPSPNPIHRDWTMPVIVLCLSTISITVVIARLWARLVIKKNEGLDNLFIVLAVVSLPADTG